MSSTDGCKCNVKLVKHGEPQTQRERGYTDRPAANAGTNKGFTSSRFRKVDLTS